MKSAPRLIARVIRHLRRHSGGAAMVEFALTAPFFLGASLWGLEVGNYALANMKVNQLAAHIADNASRVGDTSTLQNRKIFEEDINDLFIGANIQGGSSLDFLAHGNAIISSLEVWDSTIHKGNAHNDGDQFISWQRCKGSLAAPSHYGVQNDAKPLGIGPVGEEVTAIPGSAAIFVELQYDYQPLFSNRFISTTRINSTAAFVVRDLRDQTGIRKRKGTTNASLCP